jgi:hypothetical protein
MSCKGLIILDENNELLIRNGDLVIDDASQQHIALLLLSNQGDFKQHPLTGIGIMKYLNSPLNATIKAKLYRDINIQFEDNGLKDINIEGQLSQMTIK